MAFIVGQRVVGGSIISERVVAGAKSTDTRARSGVIEEVLRGDPSPQYRIRGDDTYESIVTPDRGADPSSPPWRVSWFAAEGLRMDMGGRYPVVLFADVIVFSVFARKKRNALLGDLGVDGIGEVLGAPTIGLPVTKVINAQTESMIATSNRFADLLKAGITNYSPTQVAAALPGAVLVPIANIGKVELRHSGGWLNDAKLTFYISRIDIDPSTPFPERRRKRTYYFRGLYRQEEVAALDQLREMLSWSLGKRFSEKPD